MSNLESRDESQAGEKALQEEEAGLKAAGETEELNEKSEVYSEAADSTGDAARGMEGMHIGNDTPDALPSVVGKRLPTSPPPPSPPAEAEKPFIDPTPKTPIPSRMHSQRLHLDLDSLQPLDRIDGTAEGRASTNDPESSSEIQSIMDQFADEAVAPTKEEIMSPRHEISSPVLGSPGHFPPRQSSLEPMRSRDMDSIVHSPSVSTATSEMAPTLPPPVPLKGEPGDSEAPPLPPKPSILPHQPPPPEPEPDLPFDFHRFLEQLRHKSADPVAKFLRSFLTEFGKKQWMVHEQVKIIGDFVAFITNKMALCEVWREVSENEFENAKEGMEKLVMNRLYGQTFSPAIPPPPQIPRSRSRSRQKQLEKAAGPGRRGQHQEDVERDDILAQKIRIYGWVKEEHLDIPPVGANGQRFLRLAQQELLKIKSYRAPRDKIICVLNSCKVIFGLLKNAKTTDTSADSFVPLLIYVVLQANPENLVSNVQYILRFRNQDKLGGEAGYYLSSLSGAIQFIEGLDRTTLTVSDEDFERNVEAAVSEIAAQNREIEASTPRTSITEKSSVAEPELTPRNSLEVTASPRRPSRGPSAIGSTGSSSDDSDAVAGLLRTIQRPLSTIGRIFSDQDTSAQGPSSINTPPGSGRLTPAFQQPDVHNEKEAPREPARPVVYDAQEAAARQASAEAAEARRLQRAEHRTVVETLCGMFPNLDKEVIDDVVRQKQGRVGLAVDACLGLTAGS